jgi:hypothetical protein
MRQDTSLKDPDIPSAATLGELEAEAALSDSSLADDTYDAAIAVHRIIEFERERRVLVVSANKGA